MSAAKGAYDITDFWATGINHHTSDISTRSAFAVDSDGYEALLERAARKGIRELFVLSTCNRTELYGFAPRAADLTALIQAKEPQSGKGFHDIAYVKNGVDAARHLFRVNAGLDSQILGDYEIAGQVKNAITRARESGFVGTYLDRVITTSQQSSKAIRTSTRLTSGTVSVAFAAVQCMRQALPDLRHRRILVIGAGDISRSACKNLLAVVPPSQITVINRNMAKAAGLAAELGLQHAAMSALPECLDAADVVVAATNAATPILLASHFPEGSSKLLVDLGVPNNIDAALASRPGIQLVNVDTLSHITDTTLRQRRAELPKAKLILEDHLAELASWYKMHHAVRTVRDRLPLLQPVVENAPAAVPSKDTEQAVIASLAVGLRQSASFGCLCISAFNDFIGTQIL